MNLLAETLGKLADVNQSPETIEFIGSIDGEYACTWDEFKRLADRDYDAGYGSAKVANDLAIIFKDGSWLSREEYDGSEWWGYYRRPFIDRERKPITALIGDLWPTVGSLQEEAP